MNAVSFTGHFDACVGHADDHSPFTYRGATFKFQKRRGVPVDGVKRADGTDGRYYAESTPFTVNGVDFHLPADIYGKNTRDEAEARIRKVIDDAYAYTKAKK